MQEAVYGLLGGIGGAVIAAAATYWGPLQVQKQARRDAERERGQARAEAAEARQAERQRAQVARVALVRKTVSAWCHLIEEAARRLDRGNEVDVEGFRERVERAREVTTTAIYDALNDGLHIPLTEATGPPGTPGGPPLILDALDEMTGRLLYKMTYPLDEDTEVAWGEDWIREGAAQVVRARSELSQSLMRRVQEIMDITVLDARGAEEAPSTEER